jgi:uncharacterized membrane protein
VVRKDERQERSSRLIERNISALLTQRRAEERRLDWQDRFAEAASELAGSMAFVWLHLAVLALWIAINLGWVRGVPVFDPTFVILATAASVEAIFLSTFVLITQNRMQTLADKRADLNLQISLLAEHEVTRLLQMVSEIAERMNVPAAQSPDLGELKKDVRPEEVLKTISDHEQNPGAPE